MFKKERDVTERSRTLLKNKEIRTLKADVLEAFPLLSEETLNELIPYKADVQCVKLANRTVLYNVDGKTLFFDLQGRRDLYPTLHTLWRSPTMMRSLVTHGPVSRFVLRGADFMVPGLARVSNLQGLREKEKVSLSVAGNAMPFAVGESAVAAHALLDGAGHKQKGKAMTVLHAFADLLVPSRCAPNDGFTAEEVFPTENVESERESESESESEEQCSESERQGEEEREGEESEENDLAAQQEKEREKESERENDAADDLQRLRVVEDENDVEDPQGEAENERESESREKRDAQLMEATILAFKHVIKEKQLPMLVSTFWSTLHKCHECSPSYDDTPLDIKKTSFRKVSKFLEHCQRVELFSFRDDHGIATITAVKRAHELFREYKVDDADLFRDAVQRLKDSHAAPTQASVAPGKGSKITVLELFKMPRNWRDVFGNVHGEHGEHLKSSEVRDMLMMYIKSHNLEVPDRRSSLHIEPADPVYPFLRSAVSSAAAEASKSAATAPAPPTAPREEQEDEEDEECVSSGAVAGVLSADLHSPWGAGPAIAMKIAQGGLRDVDAAPPAAPRAAPTPAPSSSRIAGGSRVGGWGVDPGKEWKPVFLPPARPPQPPHKTQRPAADKTQGAVRPKHVVGAPKPPRAKAEEEQPPSAIELSKEEFVKTILSKMTTYHAVLQPNGEINVHSGKIPRIKVIVEMRMGNKTVTLLRGIAEYDIDLNVLAKGCQKKFACSVSVSSVPGIAKEREIVLQGNYSVEIENYLVDSCGIPRHVIEVSAGKGVRLKKK